MICPDCLIQMHEKDRVGDGISLTDCYETWMILECPGCGRLVKEFYSCRVLTQKQFEDIKYSQGVTK